MENASHTPGPWHVHGGEIGPSPDETIAVVCALSGNDGDMEEEANARLIAAAPDLLAALEAVVTTGGWDNLDTGGRGTHGAALAAIAKAKGE